MREKDRDLRRRRLPRQEGRGRRNQEEVAKRKTTRTDGSKRALKPNEKEADAAGATEKKATKKPAAKKATVEDAAAGTSAAAGADSAEKKVRKATVAKKPVAKKAEESTQESLLPEPEGS